MMTTETTVLTDVSQDIWEQEFQLQSSDSLKLAGSDAWSIQKKCLHGGVSSGVDVVEINNGVLSLSVLPTRGMGIWRGSCEGLDLGWKSPVEWPVHPAFVNLNEKNGLGWLTGFNEWICRCGLSFNGPPGVDDGGHPLENPLTLHGRIANTPAHSVTCEVDTEGEGTLKLSGVVDECMMFGPNLRLTSVLTTKAGSRSFTIEDTITNRGATPAEMELLYHINTGRPFLDPGATLLAAFEELSPRDARGAEGVETWNDYAAPEVGYAEQVYYLKPLADDNGNTQVLLKNAAGHHGLSLQFDIAQLPCFALWKNTQSETEGYVTGLEPATNYPNFRSFEREQQRVKTLEPGESHQTRIKVEVHPDSDSVTQTETAIRKLQETVTPTIHQTPTEPFAPGS